MSDEASRRTMSAFAPRWGPPGVGSTLGRYHLDALLGRGGMGAVYRATDIEHDRTVALKLLTPEFADDPAFRTRFLREAQLTGRLREPHIVAVHSWGVLEGFLYLDMRLIEGQTLTEILRTDGAFPPARAVDLVAQIAAALDAAHDVGLVHRDVKPSNVLVTPQDFAILLDFGIAVPLDATRLTENGAFVGTLDYMAPERFSSGPVTPSADIYALACLLTECLTAEPPFAAPDAAAVVRAHLDRTPSPPGALVPGIPEALDAVVLRGMAKDPSARPARAGALAAQARAALIDTQQSRPHDRPSRPPLRSTVVETRIEDDPEPSLGRRGAVWRRRVLAAVLVVLVVVAGLVALVVYAHVATGR